MDPSLQNTSGNFFERHKLKITGALLIGGCYAVIRRRNSALFRGSILKTDPVLTGKTVIISEPYFSKKYSGYYAAKEFASRGAKVYVLVPQPISLSEEKAEVLRKETGNQDVHVCSVDLTSLRSIRRFANTFRQKSEVVDILVNNSDMYRPPDVHSEEGYPRRLAVNYLGRTVLTQYLLDCVNRAPKGKIVNVNHLCFSSNSQIAADSMKVRADMDFLMNHTEYFESRRDLDVYSNQLFNANKKFVSEMAKRLKETNTTINQVEMEMNRAYIMDLPMFTGVLFEELVNFYRHTHASGGKLIAYAALSEEFDNNSGALIKGGGPSAETINIEDSDIFFRHTSEVLETFEEEYPLRLGLETDGKQQQQSVA